MRWCGSLSVACLYLFWCILSTCWCVAMSCAGSSLAGSKLQVPSQPSCVHSPATALGFDGISYYRNSYRSSCSCFFPWNFNFFLSLEFEDDTIGIDKYGEVVGRHQVRWMVLLPLLFFVYFFYWFFFFFFRQEEKWWLRCDASLEMMARRFEYYRMVYRFFMKILYP